MLRAQCLGLNIWWVGGTFNRKKVEEFHTGGKVIGIVAFGYGANQGTSHKSKKIEDVSQYQGTMPEWFKNGVEAALLAPAALNRQAFFILGQENTVDISYKQGALSDVDLGIVKYHFDLGAGRENFEYTNSEKF